MNTKRFWRIKYGFSKLDQVSIPETELEKAIYAQVSKNPVQLGNSFVNGANIISITPHWHRHTGWNDFYEPTDGDDWKQIKRDCPSYDGVLEYYKERVHVLIKTGKTQQIGKNVDIPELPPLNNYQENHKRIGSTATIGELLKNNYENN